MILVICYWILESFCFTSIHVHGHKNSINDCHKKLLNLCPYIQNPIEHFFSPLFQKQWLCSPTIHPELETAPTLEKRCQSTEVLQNIWWHTNQILIVSPEPFSMSRVTFPYVKHILYCMCERLKICHPLLSGIG